MVECLGVPGFGMVGLSEDLRFWNGWTPRGHRFSFDWILRGLVNIVWSDSKRPPGIRMVGILEALQFLNGRTIIVPPCFPMVGL